MKNVIQKLFKKRQRTTNTTDEERANFVNFISNIPFNAYRPIRNDIIEATGVSRATFSMWCKTGVPRKSDRALINEVLQKYGYKKIW